MTVEFTNSRDLGKIEKFFYALGKIGLFNNFTSAIKLNKHLDFEIDRKLVIYVLQKILIENPILLTNVFDDEELRVVDDLKFEDLVEFSYTKGPMEETLSKINEIRFEYGNAHKVLFKILVINGDHLYFVFDHSIYDGISSINFLDTFLHHLNMNLPETDLNDYLFVKKLDEKYQIPPPIEEMVNYIGIPPQPSSASGELWKSDKPYCNADQIFKVLEFSPDESMKVKKLCNSHNVTITPYIQSCFLTAQSIVLENFKDLDLFNEITFGVNTRRYIKPEFQNENTTFGCNVSGHFVQSPSSKKFSWEQVIKESEHLRKITTDGSINYPFGLFVVGNDVDWETLHKAGSILNGVQTRGNLMLTNLGFHKHSGNADNSFTLKRSFFIQSTYQLGFIFSTNIISDVNGMSIVNTMVKNDEFSKEQFDNINQEFKKILLNPDEYL